MATLSPAKTRCCLALLIIFITCALSGCAGPAPRAPVSDVDQPPSRRLQEHIVAAGETLYSIAWRYGLDHRQLAEINGIDNSHRIYPGQRLSLKKGSSKASGSPPVRASSAPRVARKSPSRTPGSKPARSEKQTAPAPAPSPAQNHSSATRWTWPIQGKILAPFQSNGGLNKGIDIGGELGEPVFAAADGDVVYSGSGLRGYGKLVIVKHSEKYLSAYAHNSELLVKEGQAVKAGQQIARVGSSGTDTVKLHFEIRYDGKPVDPLKHLPER